MKDFFDLEFEFEDTDDDEMMNILEEFDIREALHDFYNWNVAKPTYYEDPSIDDFNWLLEEIANSRIIENAIEYRLENDSNLNFHHEYDVESFVEEILEDTVLDILEAEMDRAQRNNDNGAGYARETLDMMFSSEKYVDEIVDWDDDDALEEFLEEHYDTNRGTFQFSGIFYIWINYGLPIKVELDHIPSSKDEFMTAVEEAVYTDLPDYVDFDLDKIIDTIAIRIRSFDE